MSNKKARPGVPSDIVCFVFALIKPGARFYLKYPEASQFFYKCSQDPKYAHFFSGYIWNTNEWFPRCDTMSFAYDRLHEFYVNWYDDGVSWLRSTRKRGDFDFSASDVRLAREMADAYLEQFGISA